MAKKKINNDKDKRDLIVAQALKEIQFARTYKQGKIANWQRNEEMYYARKRTTDDSRANVELGRMSEFVHTLLSKIDNALAFKFAKQKESQLKRVDRLNALRTVDQDTGDWDIKDLAGKKQGVIYGRAIYSYFAESEDGYCSYLDNVDVYDFLIDPAAGGLDVEKADYLGDYGVKLNKKMLEEGAKNGTFLKDEVNTLLQGPGNSGNSSQEQTNKQSRSFDVGATTPKKDIETPGNYKFWRWGTTYEGQRYYLLLSETGSTAIRVDELEEVFESGMWWYWTWAAFIDLTEFWTPSYCDYVREIFMAQGVSINQSLDNSEEITKPTKVVQVAGIQDLASLKYKRGGNTVKVKQGFDIDKAFKKIIPTSIDTPIKMFELLESIQEKASGVTAGAKGVSGDEKVGIYEGNEANSADRFGLLNKSYAFGYKRFARLWEAGVREHLTKKTAVEMLGPDGLDIEMVSRRDIFRAGEKFKLVVEASDAELALSQADKKDRMAFLSANTQSPVQNQKKAYEMSAKIAGFKEEEIRELMDTSDFGDAELMSEAERDIERILDGEVIEPNYRATTAYKQRFVFYMQDHKEDLNNKQFRDLAQYIMGLDEVIMSNMVRKANDMALSAMVPPAAGAGGNTKVPPGSEVPALPGAQTTVPGQTL